MMSGVVCCSFPSRQALPSPGGYLSVVLLSLRSRKEREGGLASFPTHACRRVAIVGETSSMPFVCPPQYSYRTGIVFIVAPLREQALLWGGGNAAILLGGYFLSAVRCEVQDDCLCPYYCRGHSRLKSVSSVGEFSARCSSSGDECSA